MAGPNGEDVRIINCGHCGRIHPVPVAALQGGDGK